MKSYLRPWIAGMLAVSVLASGLGGGAVGAQGSSSVRPFGSVRFEGTAFGQTDGVAVPPSSLVGLDPQSTLDLLVRLEAPSLYQVLDSVEANQASAPGVAEPLAVTAIQSIHNSLALRQDRVAQAVEAAGGRVIGRLQTTSNALHVQIPYGRLADLAAVPGIRSMGRMPKFDLQLGDARPHIGATRVAEELGFTGKGVTVAVIDTGIDYMHIALGGHGDKAKRDADDDTVIEPDTFPTSKVVGGWDFVGFLYDANNAANSTPKPDMDPIDDGGHGSHVGGIVASQGGGKVDKGMAPDAKLVSLKVFGASGSTNVTVEAMEWVANHNLYLGEASDKVPGTRPETTIDVINMSLGAGYGGGTLDYEEVVESLIEHDVTVVASAGNSGATPFIVGSPSATAKVLSVANSVAPGEVALAVKAEWKADEQDVVESYDATTTAEWAIPLSESGIRSAELAWYGLACNDADGNPSAPAQDVREKIALVQRGTCTFYEKMNNAVKQGAIAVLLFDDGRGKGVMGCGAPSTCEVRIEIPGLMIDQDKGAALRDLLEAGTSVKVTMDPAAQIEQTWLTDTMDNSSSRGPGRFYAHIKPQITAPGHNILSVANGTGTEGVSFSGTSMSGPAVAGVIALLWERNRTQDLGLSSVDLAALAMNYANPVIHRGRNDTGPLEGVTRQGAGLVQAYKSATAETLVRSERGLAELSFGVSHVTSEVMNTTQTLTVRNLSDKAKTYRIDDMLAFEEQDGESGVSLSIEPSTLTIEGGESAEVEVTMSVDPANVPLWDNYGPFAVADEALFQTQEVDGYVHLTEVDAAGEPVEDGDMVGVPFHTLPMRHSCTTPDSMSTVYIGAKQDEFLPMTWSNECGVAGRAETFWALGRDELESLDGSIPPTLDFAAVGVRYGERVLPTGATAPVAQFGVATRQSSRLPIDTRATVFIDINQDGEFDFAAFRLGQAPPVSALSLFAPAIKAADGTPMVNPDQSTWLFFNVPALDNMSYNVDDTFAMLTIPLEVFGADVLFDGDLKFDFIVQVSDDVGDFTPEGSAQPVGDWGPSNFREGGRYTFDQAQLDCLKLMSGEVDWMGIDAFADLEADLGNGAAELSWGCPAFSGQQPKDLGILTHYANNAPGMDWAIRDIMLGQPKIYLPILSYGIDAPPTAEPTVPMDPTAMPEATPAQ